MQILGIEWVPLNEPLRNRLQALAAAVSFLIPVAGGLTCLLPVYLLFTRFWWLTLFYMVWMYLDKDTCNRGGRHIAWVLNFVLWRYVRDYFQSRLLLVPNFKLDPSRNYLFSCFPHGVFPAGTFTSMIIKSSEFQQLYQNFKLKSAIMEILFLLPVVRDIGLALGAIPCSANSLQYVLTKPEGGNIVILYPGGALEASYAQPGLYKFVVKKRKGFVKQALKSGASLVPVITFGETDTFKQIQGPRIKRFQNFVKKYVRFTPILYVGRGLFQYSFGVVPRKTQLTTVVGTPIEVTKTENPTDEQVDEVHVKFVEELVNLFEKYKYAYLENPEKKFLELV